MADITPGAIASGVLNAVDTTDLRQVIGDFTFLAPIEGVRQVAATGFNYKKHIEEFKMTRPTEPELFLKATTSLTGPHDPISRGPNAGTKLDWEMELAIVVGREARDISAAEAAGHILGYVCLNDISDRATQVDSQGGQHLVRAKSRPICPDRAVSGHRRRWDGARPVDQAQWPDRTAGQYQRHAVFDQRDVGLFLHAHALLPGDLLATGTPPGVGFGKNRFMATGDILECGITHLGAQRHEIRD